MPALVEPSARPRAPSTLAALLVILAVTVTAYHNSLNGALVLDDAATITDNASIRQLWPIGPVLSPPPGAGVGGRPFANLTFALNYAVGGLGVRGYHVVAILLHALSAFTLFALVRRTLLLPVLRPRFGAHASALALAVAALWAAHPLTTAVVDYISQRTEALMALCYLLTLYAFIRAADSSDSPSATGRPRSGWSIIAVLVCALGMAAKEVMVTAPVVVLLYDRTFLSGNWRAALRHRWPLHLALAATWIVLAALVTTSRVTDRGVGFGQGVTAGTYLLTECTALLHYFKSALWPHPLIFDHGWWFAQNLRSTLPALLGCLVLTALAARLLFARSPTRAAAGFALVAALMVLAPTSTVIPIVQQPIAESRMYLPLAAVIALAVISAFAAFGPRTLVVAGGLALAGIGFTLRRNADYATPITLWTRTLAQVPANARAHAEFGVALVAENRLADATAEFTTALQLRPDYPEAHNNLGALLLRSGKVDEATTHFAAAIRLRPTFADAHCNLGEALMLAKRTPEAVASFESAIRLNPRHVKAHNNLGVALLELGQVAAALTHEQAALALDPNFASAHHNLANALVQTGRLPEAITHYETALKLDPTFAKAENNLAVAHLRSGNIPAAIQHFEAALRIKPDYAEARKNLENVRGGNR